MPKTPDLLTTAQVAALTGIPVRTINRWAVSGRLPVAVKLPGSHGANLFRPSDVDRLRKKTAA